MPVNQLVLWKIGGISKEVLVDSGSASNLISQDELKTCKVRDWRFNCNYTARYCMPMVAKRLRLWVCLSQNWLWKRQRSQHTWLWSNKGGAWSEIQWQQNQEFSTWVQAPNPLAESCNTVRCPFVESLKATFPGIFSVARLKNYQLKLHIHPQVTLWPTDSQSLSDFEF